MAGRSCSLGRTVFFEAQTFATDESPDRPVVHVEPVARKLRHKPAQGEVPSRDPLPKKGGVLADQKPRPMSAHLAGGGAARRPEPLRPFHHARRADAQRPRDHPHAPARLNPRQSPFAQIHRIGSCHPPKASDSIQYLNQKPGNLGIPTDSAKFHPALERYCESGTNTTVAALSCTFHSVRCSGDLLGVSLRWGYFVNKPGGCKKSSAQPPFGHHPS